MLFELEKKNSQKLCVLSGDWSKISTDLQFSLDHNEIENLN